MSPNRYMVKQTVIHHIESGLLLHMAAWMGLKGIMLSKKILSEGNTLYDSIYIAFLK